MSSSHSRNALEKTRSDYERKLERQRKLENFKQIAAADVVVQDNGEEEATIVSFFPTADGVKKNSPMDNNSSHEAPTGAIESARRFLWDEDDDDEFEAPATTQQKTNGNDSASSRANMFFAKKGIEQDSTRLKDIRGFESPGVSDPMHDVNLNTSFRHFSVPRRKNKDESIFAPIGAGFMAVFDPILHPCSCTPKQKKVSLFSLLFLLLVAIACVVVVTVDFSSLGGQGGTPSVEVPNGPPEEESEVTDRDTLVRNFIFESGFTSNGDLENSKSAQGKALKWIIDSDEAQHNVGNPELLQRYALATFFFSTNPDASGSVSTPSSDWEKSTNWMSKHTICKWHGIQCDKGQSSVAKNAAGSTEPSDVVVHMELPMNKIKGSIPSELATLENLEILRLSENEMSGSIPPSLGQLKNLIALELQENGLTGNIPKELNTCVGLHNLHLNDNKLKGSFPSELYDLVSLRSFDLSQNDLDGDLPDFPRFTHLRRVKLDGNAFKGVIPSEAGTLKSLEELTLEDNKLYGSIPEEVGHLAHIASFNIGHNEIDGTVPSTIKSWKLIVDLRLSYNKISGPFPDELTHLANLEFLHINGNEFTGTIPESISNLTKLRVFRFSDNKFTGTVPEAVCELKTKESPEFLAEDCSKNGDMEACSCCQECAS